MVKLSNSTINKSCKIVRAYLPFSFILEVFRDITGDQDLATFPNVRKSEEAILRTSKVDVKIPFRAVDEISDYFYQEQNAFLDFLKSLTPRSIRNQVVFGVTLDDFISRVSAVLFEDSRIKIENYGIIQQWVPNTANKGIFLNIDVPDHIRDYFGEALDCSAHNLHRSSILFSTFTLEASLRYKYAELVNEDTRRTRFNKLIDWGISRNLIEQDNAAVYSYKILQLQCDALAKKIDENDNLLAKLEQDLQKAEEQREAFAKQQPPDTSLHRMLEPIRRAIVVQQKRIEELSVEREPVVLRAPFAGLVSEIVHRAGEVILPGDTVLAISENKPREIAAWVSESQANVIQKDMRVKLVKNSEPPQIANSQVVYLGPNVELAPQRLWDSPDIPKWGRRMLIGVHPDMKLLPGEIVGIRQL